MYTTYKYQVYKFLENKYGCDEASFRINNKKVDLGNIYENDEMVYNEVDYIHEHILPKKIVCSDKLLPSEEDIEKYKKRYRKNTLNDYDIKFIQTSMRLKDAYKKQSENSSKSVLLEKAISEPDMKHARVCINAVKPVKKDKPVFEIKYCKAYKMDGNKCNAKIKDGTNLCRRHKLKKTC